VRCFDPELNLKAPTEIDFGDAPDVVRYAKLAAWQRATIPVFLKQAPHQWQYTGEFRVARVSSSQRDLTRARRRRADAIGTIFLTELTERPAAPVVPDIEIPLNEATEGKKALLRHMKRERSRALIQAKKRLVRHANGELSCEACGVRERDLPAGIADAAFEAHHLQALSSHNQERVTKLDDLSIICATCHRLIHRTRPMVTVAKLRRLLNGR
jgi:predicted HNH restriction endonuclease